MCTRLTPFLLLAALVTACGGVSLDDYFAEEIAADCERKARCGEVTNVDECTAVASANPLSHARAANLRRSIAAGRISYNPARAGECLEHRRTASCDWTSEYWRTTDPDCEATFEGEVGSDEWGCAVDAFCDVGNVCAAIKSDGARCGTGWECESRFCDAPVADYGVCVPPTPCG